MRERRGVQRSSTRAKQGVEGLTVVLLDDLRVDVGKPKEHCEEGDDRRCSTDRCRDGRLRELVESKLRRSLVDDGHSEDGRCSEEVERRNQNSLLDRVGTDKDDVSRGKGGA